MAQTALANDNEDQLRAQLSALQPPRAPQLAPVPDKAPPPIIADPLKAMSGPMMLLATLGGALTGAPITSALNNATGFLKGVAYGNDYVSQQHLKEFNANVNAATKANQTAVDQYKLDLDQYGTDASRLQSALLSTAISHGDEPVQALLVSGHVKEAVELIQAKEKAGIAAQQHQDMINLRIDSNWKPAVMLVKQPDGTVQPVDGEYNVILGGYRNLQGVPIPKDTVAQRLPGNISSSEILPKETLDFVAKAFLSTGNPQVLQQAAGGMFGSNPAALTNRANLQRTIQTLATKPKDKGGFGLTPEQLAQKMLQVRSVIQGYATLGNVAARISIFAAEGDQSAQLLEALSDKVPRNSNLRSINAIRQWGQRQLSQPEITALDNGLFSFAQSYARVASGGTEPHQTVIEETMKHLNTAIAQKGFKAGVETLRAEMHRMQAAPGMAVTEFQKSLGLVSGEGMPSVGNQVNDILGGGASPSVLPPGVTIRQIR